MSTTHCTPKTLTPSGIYRELSAILEKVNSFHKDTQHEFQFLHMQYLTVSKKITSILQNLTKLQSIFNNKDINALIKNLNEVKSAIREINLSDFGIFHPAMINRQGLTNIMGLQNTVSRLKKEFRHELIAQSIQSNNDSNDIQLTNTNIRELITTDLVAMIGILENALNMLLEIFGGNGKKSRQDTDAECQHIVRFIDYLVRHILEFHGNFENNLEFIAQNFEVCRQTGDEIITALQYQDIFSQKLTHIITIIENIRVEFEPARKNGPGYNKYSCLMPEISSILMAQVKFIQDEFRNSTTSIITRLNAISNWFVNSREDFRKLDRLVNPDILFQFGEGKDLKDEKDIVRIGENNTVKVNGRNHPGDQKIESLGGGIDRVIGEIRVIKGKIREVIMTTLEPGKLAFEKPVQEEIEANLAANARMADLLGENPIIDMRHSELLKLSNELFDEVIVSLQAAKQRYLSIEKMYGTTGQIISGLEALMEGDYPCEGEISEMEKSVSLEKFRKSYSMQSERFNHDQALGKDGGEDLEMFQEETEVEKGDVELF